MGRPNKYPDQFRKDALELVKTSQRPIAEVARSLGIAEAEWITAGVLDELCADALAAIVELDLSEFAIDGRLHKAPHGGEGAGANPTDRGRCDWKWSFVVDRHGIPLGRGIDAASRNDVCLLEPTIDSIAANG